MNASSFRLSATTMSAVACATLLGGLQARDNDKPLDWGKARDATTERALQIQAAASRPLMDQLVGMKQPLGETVPTQGHSLYTKSIILFDGEMYTLIPVGSVLQLPAHLRNRVVSKAQGEFTFWPSFLERNAAWLAPKEVSLKMARGDAKLAAITLKETSMSTRMLVSVYKGCPISVLEAPPQQTTAAKP